MSSTTIIHPQWSNLLKWLTTFGVEIKNILVEPRIVIGAGYGLFTLTDIQPSTPLFTIPAKALLNSLTLEPLYPLSEKLSCTQLITLHLSLNRPLNHLSNDIHFGPYISVLPENFVRHPFSWIWKSKYLRPSCNDFELTLLQSLPSRITRKLEQMCSICEKDREAVEMYMDSQPTLRGALKISTFQDDYLWAWLNVNTRCIYHRIRKSRSDPDNMTLCPILDFANHAMDTPTVYPQPTRGEVWDTGPSIKRKFGENFTLLAPSQHPTKTGDELFLKYGSHSNATLFTEYGFVLLREDIEVEVTELVEELFNKRGATGAWMKEVLTNEGYWGDWTLHSSPEPAYPSYRLITALRLYHCIPESDNESNDSENVLKGWRDVIYGVSMTVAEENERLWRQTLLRLCQSIVQNAQKCIIRVRSLQEKEKACLPAERNWELDAWSFIETLWQEEVEVGRAVITSLESGVEF